VKRSVTVELSALAIQALEGEERGSVEYLPGRLRRGIRYYLSERGSNRTEWRYPNFMRHRKPSKLVKLELNVDETLWNALETEAARQGVTTQRMLEHAALFFASDVNAGRVTERILERLAEEDDVGETG